MMPEPQFIVSPLMQRIMKSLSLNLCNSPATWTLQILLVGLLSFAIAGCNPEMATEPASTQARPTQVSPVQPTPTLPEIAFTPESPAETPPAAPSPTELSPPSGPGYSEAADSFPVPPDRDYYRLAEALLPGAKGVDPVVRQNAPTLQVGHRETLNLVDLEAPLLYESDFELRLVTPNAYWFIEDGLEVDQEDLEKSASEFEDTIYPTETRICTSSTPG